MEREYRADITTKKGAGVGTHRGVGYNPRGYISLRILNPPDDFILSPWY
jgi:hypothetical protein